MGFEIDPSALPDPSSKEPSRPIPPRTTRRKPNPSTETDILQQIVGQTRREPVVISRMTSGEIQALKTRTVERSSVAVSFKRAVLGFLVKLQSAATGAFSRQHRDIKSRACHFYGHVPPAHGYWQGTFPRCQDCGEEITAPDQIRGSTARR